MKDQEQEEFNRLVSYKPWDDRGGLVLPKLTKREYFAGLAMQGIMSNKNAMPTEEYHFVNIIEDSIRVATELLKQLEK